MAEAISVVIPTFERPDSCAAAVESALGQTHQPLEVLVCDDGSRDDTPERFAEWAREDPRVRYLQLPAARRPAPARNAGVRAARGEWVAFLDDDDRWRPDKLAVQAPHLAAGRVVASNAERSSGGAYFETPPDPEQILRVNPIITSTAVAERAAVLRAGGFHEARWARGVEDYALWLRLADLGARFVILPDVTADYHEAPAGRLSNRVAQQEAAVARLAWQRWTRRPHQLARLTAAGNHTVAAWRARG